MGIGKVIIKQLAKVAKDSGKLEKGIDQVKDKVISKGLELVEESGVDSSQLPIDLPQFLRGESPNITFKVRLCFFFIILYYQITSFLWIRFCTDFVQ